MSSITSTTGNSATRGLTHPDPMDWTGPNGVVSSETNRSTSAFPNRCQISCTTSGWSLYSPGGSRSLDKTSATWLSDPGRWTALNEASRYWDHLRILRVCRKHARVLVLPWWFKWNTDNVLLDRDRPNAELWTGMLGPESWILGTSWGGEQWAHEVCIHTHEPVSFHHRPKNEETLGTHLSGTDPERAENLYPLSEWGSYVE